ncbi:hypothetical protein FRC06_005613 [Ceratobasidium sp. 370]|nr:hypothetical protein FRC06_005613 [Ceratobasidium sp. 370]
MAGTSERVVGALVEMRESCSGILQLDESPRARYRSAPNGKGAKVQEDAHLKTLQILSAHLKLLLDSPEHLWRWLEKKQFLHAAWLFLLARTVHRKLSKSADEEESDEEENEGGDINWSRHGIDITEQFPIAARQWEAIGQFRPQIVHKATQALREPGASHKEVAETLIAILLLDALSSARTRNLFLSQRGKTLAILLNPPLSAPRRPISPNRAQNRKATAALLSPASPARSLPSPSIQLLKTPVPASVENAKAERKAVKEVVKSFRTVFSLIGGTIATVRAIYGSGGLLAQIISDIQTDVPIPAALPTTASQPHFPSPSGLQPSTQPPRSLTTPQILQSLPSSSLLLRFLPSSIVGYTPYISTESNDLGTESDGTEEELKVWMNMALEALVAPAKTWLDRLDSVRAVWTVRSSVINGIASLEGTREVKNALERALRAERVTQRLLATFRDLLAAGLPVEHVADQVVWDLMFVKEMQRAIRKETRSENAEEKDASDDMNSEETQKLVAASIKNQLCRSQLLFSALLDAGVAQAAKQTQSRTQNIFLPLGVPPSETDFRPALELVKPGQRFGMLPVAAVAYK